MQASTGRSGQRPLSKTVRTKAAQPPAKDKEERQAEPASGARFFYSSSETGAKVAFLCRKPELSLRGQRPPACSEVLHLSDLTSVINSNGAKPAALTAPGPICFKEDALLGEVTFSEDALLVLKEKTCEQGLKGRG